MNCRLSSIGLYIAMVTSYAVTLLGQACHLEFLIRNLVFPLFYLFIWFVVLTSVLVGVVALSVLARHSCRGAEASGRK